jgi:hypothetical protein
MQCTFTSAAIRPLLAVVLAAGLAAGLAGAARAGVVLNEILARNYMSGTDEDGDAEDWVELHNTTGSTVDLAGWLLSDDPAVPGKWKFPEISIPPHGFLRVWLSGKDRFVPPPETIAGNPGAFAFRPTFIGTGADWQYLIGNAAAAGPPAGWYGPGFDAAAAGFATGCSGFGYSDDDDCTVTAAGTTTIFIRKSFRVGDPAAILNLVLQVDADDGFVAWLNGTRVASQYAPDGEITFQSLANASHEAGTPSRYDLTPFKDRLVAGDNVIALAGLNISSGSTDLSLRPELGSIPLVLHANFKLDAGGEVLLLSDPTGSPVDQVQFGAQTEDHAYGRSPDGTGDWFYLLTPTPEAANLTRASSEPFSGEVTFSPGPGKFAKAVQVTLSVTPGGAEVRYTTDGSAPTAASTPFTAPIAVSTNTVFRAAGFIDGERSTRIASKSYLIGGTIALPILSASMDPADYVKVHTDSWASGRASERPGYLEIFDASGAPGPAIGFGLRLNGGAGRDGDINTKKSYKCYFRPEYGADRLKYGLIPDTTVARFEKLTFRAGFNDAFRCGGGAAYLRDQVIRDLHRDMGALAAHGSWCNLYVNMRYRGLYNVTERMDHDFLRAYTGEEAWDVIKTGNDILDGDNTEWERLHTFVTGNDLSRDDLFEGAAAMIDLENFTSYMIVNTWAQNHDWPHNNWYAARPRRADGRWIFMCWDAEFGLGLSPGGYSTDSFEFALSQGCYLRDFFYALLQNASYRAYFIAEVDRHLFFALKPANVLARIDAVQKVIAPDMPEEAALTGNTAAQWSANVATVRQFASSRGTVYRNFILNSTRWKFPAPPRVFSCDPASAVNTGSTVVRLRGPRLTSTTRFTFDDRPAQAVKVGLGTDPYADVTLPADATLTGFPAIVVTNPKTGESSLASGLLEVLPPVPVPRSIDPPTGDPRGGEKVVISGEVLLAGAAVTFGGVPAASVTVTSPVSIEAVTPPGLGPVEVLVVNRLGGVDVPAKTPLRFDYGATAPFVRADVNGDGIVDLSDPVRVLVWLFLGGEAPACLEAADFDDSGRLDQSDAVAGLVFLFTGGAAPRPPYPDCAADPTPDEIGCAAVRCGGGR